jgi:very-short-patch-repair endonuclease
VLPDDLLALTAGQGGAFKREQALAAEVAAQTLAAKRRRGGLRVVRRGIYAPTTDPPDPTDEEAQRAHAAATLRATAAGHVLHAKGDVVVSHAWAAAIHGWSLLAKELPAEPDLTRAREPGEPPDTRPGLHICGLPPDHRMLLFGLPITTPPRTLCDCARTMSPEAAIVAADSALRQGCSRAEARAVAATCTRWPGIRQARAILDFADARADSALESRTRWRLAQQGLPAPELQLTLCTEYGRDVGEVDFVWREHRTILETDGRLKYQDDDKPRDDNVLWREKLREDALRALGFVVVRAYWSDSAEQLAAKVLAAFALAQTFPTAASYGHRYTTRRREQMAL